MILLQVPTISFILVIVGGLSPSGSWNRNRGFRAWHNESWYHDRAWKESGIKKDRYDNFSEKENTGAIESQGTRIERLQKQITQIRELILQLQA